MLTTDVMHAARLRGEPAESQKMIRAIEDEAALGGMRNPGQSAARLQGDVRAIAQVRNTIFQSHFNETM